MDNIETKTTTLKVERNKVAAVALAMARNDVRNYLNGAMFECLDNGNVACVATDGHRLHACLVGTWEGDKQDFILGNSYVDMLTKAMSKELKSILRNTAEMTVVTTITTRPNPDYNPEKTEDDIAMTGSPFKEFVTSATKITFPYKEMEVTVKPIEGKYPDWRRVMMQSKEKNQQWHNSDIVNEWVFIQPSYQKDVVKAFSLLDGNKKLSYEISYMRNVATFGLDKPVIFTDTQDSGFVALVMPCRANGSVYLNMPSWVFS